MDVETDGGGSSRLDCTCSCPCCGPGSLPSSAGPRTLKRKIEKMEEEARRGRPMNVARVDIEIEAAALRDALGSQQQSIKELYSELEEERGAASTAASEAMSMILRLQREKAEVQMDARQFKCLAEERMSHDQQEISILEDLLFKRDQAVKSLSCELQAYRHRLLSYGIDPAPTEPNSPTTPTAAGGGPYPPLRCELEDFPATTTDSDLKYAAGDTPRGRLPCIVMEKGVIGNSQSPRSVQRYTRRVSIDSYDFPSLRQELGNNEFSAMADRASDTGGASGRDDMSDRVYTVDAVHGVERMYDDSMSSPREFVGGRGVGGGNVDDGEIKRLNMRLQALDAERESMRQAMITMGTDKAQMVLLREIAQLLCKESMPGRRVVKKPSILRSFSVTSLLKRLTSVFFWRKRLPMIKYSFGLSSQGTGLLVLLEKSHGMRQKRYLTRGLR